MTKWMTHQFIRVLHVAICLSLMLPLLLRPSALHRMIFKREDLAHGCLYLTFFTASIFSYFIASYSDPGYLTCEKAKLFRHRRGPVVKRDGRPIDESACRVSGLIQPDSPLENPNDLYQLDAEVTQPKLGHLIPRGWLDFSRLTHWIICAFAFLCEGKLDFTEQHVYNLSVPIRFCKYCLLEQPLRCRHCPDCNRCVMKFDHHCPWIANCVGERNHSYFVAFLALHSLVLWWTIYLACVSIVPNYHGVNWFYANGLPFAELLLLSFLGVPLTALLVFHTYLALASRTTWETLSYKRIVYLQHLEDRANPFNQGCARNCYSFCCSPFPFGWDRVYAESVEKHTVAEKPFISCPNDPMRLHIAPTAAQFSCTSIVNNGADFSVAEIPDPNTCIQHQPEDIVILSSPLSEEPLQPKSSVYV